MVSKLRNLTLTRDKGRTSFSGRRITPKEKASRNKMII
jgi:hypothetical protein